MRASWLADLEALGIPYVIVVGDGDGRIEGDIVHLDAPDDYEGLPQKTLKTVEWVYENTDFSYMLKIDDDCFVNVDEYFFSQSYRKFHYYGRHITRDPGSMNRAWHHEKSRSERGRMELDKSPEPSSYADGGGGYMLSRRAMQALLLAARSPEGQRLVHSSFMEDKMAGDLLNMRGINVGSEDYYTSIWRRTHGPAQPVMRWDNYFLPSAASPCKMIHLDTETAQGWTHGARNLPTLLPRKLWPTFQRAGLGFNSNQLELMSDEARLAELNAADLAVICVCHNELDRLPVFLAHYRALGVTCFLFVDNLSDDGSREFLLEQPDCVTFSCDTHYNVGAYGTTWQLTLMASLRTGRWSLVADIDELIVYPGWDAAKPSLPGYVTGGALGTADAVRLQMVDMYPQGPLSEADLSEGSPFEKAGFTDRDPLLEMGPYRGVFSNDRTLASSVRHRILPGSRPLLYLAQKYALVRYMPWMRFSEGLHFMAEGQVAEQELVFCHFKYDAAFEARVRDEVDRGLHFNAAEEYRLYLAALSEGGLSLHDPQVSVPWRDSAPVRALLG
ncbi:glycosyltransferase family 2 protein [Pseudooceanicola nanhaiensis]|nr:glycosyltransferase family 2 protein [Pseudooceanicola nanhaiensis]